MFQLKIKRKHCKISAMETSDKERLSEDCRPAIKQFECAICKTNYIYKNYSKYRNAKTQFCTLEEVYYMDDPFDKSSSMPFILGGKCTACFKSVCIAMKCSVFYTKRFCTFHFIILKFCIKLFSFK